MQRSFGLLTILVSLLVLPAAADDAPNVEAGIAQTKANLKSDDKAVRKAAIESLIHSDMSAKMLAEMRQVLGDRDGEVRAVAATAIGNLGAAAREAVPQLIVQLAGDDTKEARETAARALGRIGKAAPDEKRPIEALRKASRDDVDSVTRVVALGGLAMMNVDLDQQIVAIRKFLRCDDPLTRMKASHALGGIGLPAKGAAAEIVAVLQAEMGLSPFLRQLRRFIAALRRGNTPRGPQDRLARRFLEYAAFGVNAAVEASYRLRCGELPSRLENRLRLEPGGHSLPACISISVYCDSSRNNASAADRQGSHVPPHQSDALAHYPSGRARRPPLEELGSRAAQDAAEAGAMSLFRGTTQDHFSLTKHLTAEAKMEEFVAGKGLVARWERLSKNNHWFDALYYACGAGSLAGVRLIQETAPAPAPRRSAVICSGIKRADGRAWMDLGRW